MTNPTSAEISVYYDRAATICTRSIVSPPANILAGCALLSTQQGTHDKVFAMRWCVCKKWGPPSSLVIEEGPPLRQPGAGEVVIAVSACAVNFPDLLVVQVGVHIERARELVHHSREEGKDRDREGVCVSFFMVCFTSWGRVELHLLLGLNGYMGQPADQFVDMYILLWSRNFSRPACLVRL